MIQIDMEMPKSCMTCPMLYDQMYCSITEGKVGWSEYEKFRMSDCPLKEAPSGEWIPVTEKLPEPMTFVNATCRSLVDNREDWVIETIYLPIPKEANKKGYSDWGDIPMLNWGEAEVIAWMERIIPEPYKVEEQGENDNNYAHPKTAMEKEQIKQTIEGFTEFMQGMWNNPNLAVPKELAEKYDISPKYCDKGEEQGENT